MTPISPPRQAAPEAPPAQDNRKALLFAVLAHLLLLAVLIVGLDWHAENPGPVQVELWADGHSPVPPVPQAQAEVDPPQPEPEPLPAPLPLPPKVETNDPRDPDIALEAARKQREQAQKEQAAAEAAKEKARLEEAH